MLTCSFDILGSFASDSNEKCALMDDQSNQVFTYTNVIGAVNVVTIARMIPAAYTTDQIVLFTSSCFSLFLCIACYTSQLDDHLHCFWQK
jgi:hypothetical protein